MRRTVVVLAFLAAVAGAVALTWLWWTASPSAPEAELAAALAAAPAADGRLAIAQPSRAARWLLRHPQAAALPVMAAAPTRAALPRLQPLLRPLLEGADGPLLLWWRGGELAVAARLRPGSARGVEMLAARADLAFRAGDGLTVVATVPELLAGSAAGAPAVSGGDLAALAVIAGAEWRAVARRSSLAAWTGAATELPAAGAASRADSVDARRRAAALGVEPGSEPMPLRFVLAVQGAWAAAVPARVVPGFIRNGMARVAGAGAPPAVWNGLLGEVLVRADGDRLLFATDESTLAAVAAPATADEGVLLGADVVAVTSRLAGALEGVPLLGREARMLRAAADLSRGLASARWRSTAAGSRIELSW
jgi:hypothetical protein